VQNRFFRFFSKAQATMKQLPNLWLDIFLTLYIAKFTYGNLNTLQKPIRATQAGSFYLQQ